MSYWQENVLGAWCNVDDGHSDLTKKGVANFALILMIAGDCSKSWRMRWKRLNRQAFFSDRREWSSNWILVLASRFHVTQYIFLCFFKFVSSLAPLRRVVGIMPASHF